MHNSFSDAAKAVRDGRPVVVINELRAVGVVSVPIDRLTPEHITFLVTECRGIVYAAVPSEHLARLEIPRQTSRRGPEHIYVPVDLARGTTTGVSSQDRTRTVRALTDPSTGAEDLRIPGHVTPMALDDDGVLGRLGLAEAAQEVADAAGASRGVVLCGVMDAEGLMAGRAHLSDLADRWELSMVTIADALAARRRRDGWSTHAPRDVVHLPYAGLVAHVRSVGEIQVADRMPVEVFPLCARGHALGACRCVPRTRAVQALLDAGHRGAAVAVRVVDGPATCDEPLPAARRDAIARLVAADHAGARPAPLDLEVATT